MIRSPNMAYSTRSHGSVNTDSETEKGPKPSEERERANKRAELIDIQSLYQTLVNIQSNLDKLQQLPEQVNLLEQKIQENEQRFNEPSGYDECGRYEMPMPQEESSVTPPTLKLKDVVANVPSYDGYKISIFQFARACERARDLLPSVQEPQLVQFVINKLEGDAFQVVEGTVYTRIIDLLDKLKSIFAPHKSVAQYRGELANAYKLPNETILKYAGRIKDLKTAILDGRRRLGRGYVRGFQNEVEEEVLEAFINGLPSNIITRMEHRNIATLDEAIEWAVRISKNLEVEKQRERQYLPKSFPVSRSDVNIAKSPVQEQPKSILKNPNSNPLVPKPWIKPLVPGQPGPNSPTVCRYCKNPGHEINACRKLAYRNAMQNSGNAEGRPSGSATQGTAPATAHPIVVQTEPIIMET